jgi:hypothetical protein
MEFTVALMRRNSPFTGCPSMRTAIVWERSPFATASITRANSVVGRTRSSIRALMASTLVFQAPSSRGADARSAMSPSRPTTRRTRAISLAMRAFASTMRLKATASSFSSGEPPGLTRTEKSPPTAASIAAASAAKRPSASAPVPRGARRRGRCGGVSGSSVFSRELTVVTAPLSLSGAESVS